MIKITDEKILVFSDLHIGIKSNSILRLDIAEELIDEIIRTIIKQKIKTVIFCGDWHHERPSISVDTLCRSIRMIKKITKHAKLFFILGNHDIRDNISTDVSSVKFLEDIKNVTLINEPTEVMIGKNKTLMCPWLSKLDNYEKESYDALFGHFDISHKYLIESYMEEHLSEDVSQAEISNLMIKSGYEFQPTVLDDKSIIKTSKVNSKKYIGKFVELCKKGGKIYSGHIHHRRNFKLKGRNFTFLGSPLQLNWGDYSKELDSSNRGYYIIDTNTMKSSFIENKVSPVHRKYFISELSLNDKSLDEIFKRELIENNFIRLILNKQFNFQQLSKIINLINSYGPKEPCVVDYDFSIDFESTGTVSEATSMNTSKLEYIHEYISSLDDSVFETFSVKRDIIIDYVTRYFKLTEEQLG